MFQLSSVVDVLSKNYAVLSGLREIQAGGALISDVLYQRPQGLTFAQVRDVIDATRSGSSAKKFHAAQDLSTMSS